MLRKVEKNLGPTQETVPFSLLSGIAPRGRIAMIGDVARRRHQIGTENQLNAIEERAGDALGVLGFQG